MSYTPENSKDDECRENVPPGITPSSQSLKLEAQIDSTEGCASTNLDKFESCISSTPAPGNNNVKAKSRLSGIQSALTPILKYLNIGNKGSSPEALAQGNNTGRTVSMKTARALSQQSEITSSCSRQQQVDTEVCWLADECLPDITLLDATCDATMMLTKNNSALADSLPSTPLRAHLAQTSLTPKPSPQTNLLKNGQSLLPPTVACLTEQSNVASKNTSLVLRHSSDAEKNCLDSMHEATSDKQESNVTCPLTTCNLSSNPAKMEMALTMSNASSHDSHHSSWEKLSFSEVSSADGTHAKAEPTKMLNYDGDATSKDQDTRISDFPDSIEAPLCFLDSRFFPEITLLDVTYDTVSSPQSKTPSTKIAPNIPSVDNLQSKHPCSEKSTQELNTSNLVRSDCDFAGNKLNSCSKQSVKCVGENMPKVSLEMTRDISMESFLEDSRPSVEFSSQSLNKTQTHVLETVVGNPANLTRDISSSSIASAPSDTQYSTNTKNATFELDDPLATMNAASEDHPLCPDGDLSSGQDLLNPKASESVKDTFVIAEQVSDLSANKMTPKLCSQNQTLELPANPRVEVDKKNEPLTVNDDSKRTPVISDSCPSVKPGASQNVTFERHSLQRSTNTILIGEDAATSGLENNTFDVKSSKQNATITMCETSSSDSQQSSLEKQSPPKACPATGSPKGENVELPLATEHNATKSDAAETVCTPECKSKSDPSIHGDSDVSVHQSMGIEENRGIPFCLDETLDLREERLITSTPMVDSKMFSLHIERDQGKMPAQKKLYKDPQSMPNGQLSSNIVSDRKTFLKQPAAKLVQPPLKAGTQIVMKKPPSAIPGRPEPGEPMTRLRSQAEALIANASDAAKVAAKEMPCYNLRATTAGSKHHMSSIQKPRSNFLQSGIQRAPQTLRPPTAKCTVATSAGADNPQVAVAAGLNPVMKISLGKKYHVSKPEVLPVAKKKKIDAPLPSETLASSCTTMNETKNLKRPTTSHKHLPIKTPRFDVPANTTEMTTSASTVNKVRALKQPATRQMSQLPKPEGNGCAKCVMLEEQLKIQAEKIRSLKEELQQYTKPAQD